MGKSSKKKKEKLLVPVDKSNEANKNNTFLLHLIPVILIFVISILAYSNTMDIPFQLDDNYLIADNPAVKDISIFFNTSSMKGSELYGALLNRYVSYLTFALDYKIHGLNIKGYHLVNTAIHILTGLLVYFLVLLTFRTPFMKDAALEKYSYLIASFSGLLFVSHPLQTEAITYIFQRVASLVTLFYLLSLLMYIKGRLIQDGKAGISSVFWFIGSFLAAVVAMRTKENAFTLPLAISLYEFSFFKGELKPRIYRLVPFLMTMVIVPITLLIITNNNGNLASHLATVSRGDLSISRHDYLLTQFRVIVTYIRLLFFPVNQNFDHDYQTSTSIFNTEVLSSLGFLLALFGLAIYLFRRSKLGPPDYRLISFGILWFFLTLSVESSIIPIPMIICEYRVYLASPGAFWAITTGAFLLIKRLNDRRTWIISASVFVPIILVFSAAAYARNTVWESRISLWSDVVKKSPEKERGHTNLANAYKIEGRADEALHHFQVAVKIKPDSAKAHYNVGVAYSNKNMTDKAVDHYLTALKINPSYPEAHNNLGAAYASKGLTDMAIEHYLTALRLNPKYLEAHSNIGASYAAKGLTDKAIEHYQEALKINPDFPEANNNLGSAFKSKGLNDKAAEYYIAALTLKPDLVEAHYNLGYIYFEKKDLSKARTEFETVLRLKPDMQYAKQLIGEITKLQKHK